MNQDDSGLWAFGPGASLRPWALSPKPFLHRRQFVPHLVLLGLEVSTRRLRGGNFERQPLRDGQAVTFDADELPRVVAEQPHRTHAEIAQNLHADAVVALVGLESETFVGLNGVEPLILQLVSANLVREADAPPFLIQIEQDAAALLRNPLHGRIE